MKYMTIEEVSEFLSVTRMTIYNYMDLGLPSYKIGNSRRFDKEEVIEWIKERKDN